MDTIKGLSICDGLCHYFVAVTCFICIWYEIKNGAHWFWEPCTEHTNCHAVVNSNRYVRLQWHSWSDCTFISSLCRLSSCGKKKSIRCWKGSSCCLKSNAYIIWNLNHRKQNIIEDADACLYPTPVILIKYKMPRMQMWSSEAGNLFSEIIYCIVPEHVVVNSNPVCLIIKHCTLPVCNLTASGTVQRNIKRFQMWQ